MKTNTCQDIHVYHLTMRDIDFVEQKLYGLCFPAKTQCLSRPEIFIKKFGKWPHAGCTKKRNLLSILFCWAYQSLRAFNFRFHLLVFPPRLLLCKVLPHSPTTGNVVSQECSGNGSQAIIVFHLRDRKQSFVCVRCVSAKYLAVLSCFKVASSNFQLIYCSNELNPFRKSATEL